MICTRCQKDKIPYKFFQDSDLPTVCLPCLTVEEVNTYCLSDITKEMAGLNIREKKKIILAIVKDFKQKRRELKWILKKKIEKYVLENACKAASTMTTEPMMTGNNLDSLK